MISEFVTDTKEASVAEHHRAKFYDWVRDHNDQETAEYVMSCLAPVPLSDLVTKEHLDTVLDARFSAFALILTEQREADRKEHAEQREADRKEHADQRAADRKEHADQRAADHRVSTVRHYWLAGIGMSAVVPIWLSAAGVIG